MTEDDFLLCLVRGYCILNTELEEREVMHFLNTKGLMWCDGLLPTEYYPSERFVDALPYRLYIDNNKLTWMHYVSTNCQADWY